MAPSISVLMPAYNAERYVLRSVNSVLAQTDDDFELLVVNDGSTDRTLDILSEIADPRLRILDNPKNMGIVGSLNRAMHEAVGKFIARADADDICLPTRFQKQRRFLEENPQTLLVGSAMTTLSHGAIHKRDHAGLRLDDFSSNVLRWMLHVSNPIGHPSMMFRSEIARTDYLREDFKYAEDFDFSHRVVTTGEVRLIPEYLVMYRQHDTNLTLLRHDEMVDRTACVLKRVYADLFDQSHDEEADLVARHMVSGAPCPDEESMRRLGLFLNKLIPRFATTYALEENELATIIQFTSRLWWRMIQATLRAGDPLICAKAYDACHWASKDRPKHRYLARSFAASFVSPRIPRTPPVTVKKFETDGLKFKEASDVDQPPTLYVVVDTEAEFDWKKDFDRDATDVSSMKYQILAQRIFDAYGARPIYLVDYPVASKPEGYEPLREIFQRKGCVVGAHLHPWVNPPFEELVSDRNSYECNLPAELEERKLRTLQQMINQNFGVSPMFFKAGRYGVGRQTIETLKALGVPVDFSILPFDDLRSIGGMDFRYAESCPYQVQNITSVPMTRGQIGLLAPLVPSLHSALRRSLSMKLHLPGMFSWLRMANTITLTPEGVSADEQIKLIKSMVRKGSRTFVLHYHSPSLAKMTPYVESDGDLVNFLDTISTVCSYFFDTLGGLPGNPADLVPSSMRDRVYLRG